MNELLVRIRFPISLPSGAEKASAQTFLRNPEAITHLTLADTARESDSNDASIIRFCKRLGYYGYSDLRRVFTTAIIKEDEVHEGGIEESGDVSDILEKMFQNSVQTFQNVMVLVSECYKDALDVLIDVKPIHFFRVGDAFAACQLAFMKFYRLGIPRPPYNDMMLQYTIADNLGPGDVVLAASYEGGSRNVVRATKIAKKRGAIATSITKMNKPPLLRYADISLFISTSDLTVGRGRVTWRVADQFILDVLYLGYITKKR